MADPSLILVTDDDEDVRELVGLNLRRAGFDTVYAADGLEALHITRQRRPHAVILDVMMPKRDGYWVCAEIRRDDAIKETPIIMLTAKGSADHRITGLEKGADDYVTKPFSPKELVLRVQAVLRRVARTDGAKNEFVVGPFHFDLASIRLLVSGEPVELTMIEFKLLHLLAMHRDEVMDRNVLLSQVFGYSDNVRSRALDTHVRRLREKLAGHGEWLHTARGHGYMFKKPEE